jgi:hypothetical protein
MIPIIPVVTAAPAITPIIIVSIFSLTILH